MKDNLIILWGILVGVIKFVGINIAIITLYFLRAFYFGQGLYSNHYIPLKIYEENESFFHLTALHLTKEKNILGTYGLERCRHTFSNSKIFMCTKKLSPTPEFQKELTQLGISSIEQSHLTSECETKIIYYIAPSNFPLGQYQEPGIEYHPLGGHIKSGGYLPFPISNKYIYLGSTFLILDEHWIISRESDLRTWGGG